MRRRTLCARFAHEIAGVVDAVLAALHSSEVRQNCFEAQPSSPSCEEIPEPRRLAKPPENSHEIRKKNAGSCYFLVSIFAGGSA
jgi:hypothetical protein